MEENQVEETQASQAIEQAVDNVQGVSAEARDLAKKVLKGEVENPSPEQAAEVQSILESAKASIQSQPEAARMLQAVQSSLRPVIEAGLSSMNEAEATAEGVTAEGLSSASESNEDPGLDAEPSGDTSSGSEDGSEVQSTLNQAEPESQAPDMGTPTAQADGGFTSSATNSTNIAGRAVRGNLGGAAEVANANIMTPFVEQAVRSDGQLGGSVGVEGQVGDLADLSGQGAAGNVGGGDVSQLLNTVSAEDPVNEVEAPAEPPPPPIGKVSIKTEDTSRFVLESAEGETRVITFTLTRTDATSKASVNWKAEGITLDTLAPGEELEGVAQFLPGQATTTVELLVQGDNIEEATQTVTVKLGDTQGLLELGEGALEAEATIQNDDSVFSVTRLSAPDLEGAQGESPALTYRIDRTDTTVATTVDWTLSGLQPQDFPGNTLPQGTINFAAGQSSTTVNIATLGDNLQEKDLTAVFKLTESGPNSIINTDQNTIEQKIDNDDSVFSIVAVNTTQREGAQRENPEITYTITRTDATVATTVNWSLEGLDPADFGGTLPTGTIEFEKGQLETTLALKTKGDNLEEADRTATLRLTGTGPNATIDADKQAASTQITNDDGTFSITAAKASQLEDAEGENPDLVYTITRTDATMPTFVKWALDGLQASDFDSRVLPSGTIEFAEGQTEATITLKPKGDNIEEGSPVATVRLTEVGQHATIDANARSASTTIENDDGVFSVVAQNTSQLEGADGETPTLTYTIKRTDATVASSVKWAVEGLNPNDFESGILPSGEVQFEAGQTQSVIQIALKGDNAVEATRTATLKLSDSGPNSTISTTEGTAQTIIEDDDSVISTQALRTEQPEGQPTQERFLNFTVTRTDGTVATSVDWELQGLKASDFGGTLPSGKIDFAQGQTTADIKIATKVDYLLEADETATLKLSSPGDNSTLHVSDAHAQTVVRTDDLGYIIEAIQDSTVEGSKGEFKTLSFKVSRDGNLDSASSVKWEVAGLGEAVASGLFKSGTLPSGTLQFAANEKEKTIEIEIAGNDQINGEHDFLVVLKEPSISNPILVGTTKGTILDDDALVSVKAVHATVQEGDSGTTDATFKVTRSGNLESSQTVNWKLSAVGELGITANDFAIDGGKTTGQFTFGAHQSEIEIKIPIQGNNIAQSDKTFTLDLEDTDGNNYALGQSSAQVTIVNDDSTLGIKPTKTNLLEGSIQGSENGHQFVIERGVSTKGSLEVDWQVKTSGNPSVAAANVGRTPPTVNFNQSVDAADFGGTLPSGTVTFAAGETQKVITITPSADTTMEQDENFSVEISSTASGVQIVNSTAQGKVFSDEATLQFAQDSYSISEGDQGTMTLNAVVERSGFFLQQGSFEWRLVPTGNSPVTTNDFAANQDGLGSNNGFPSGKVDLETGDVSKTIELQIAPDSILESSETFKLEIINPSTGHVLGDRPTANGTLLNDDAEFAVTNSVQVRENSGTMSFDVSRSGNLEGTDTVQWKLILPEGSNASAADFAGATSGTLTFAPNMETNKVNLDLLNDDIIEGNETFEFEIFNPSIGNTIETGSSKVQGTIQNDDFKVTLQAVTDEAFEGNDSNGVVRYKAIREGDLSQEASVNWKILPSGSPFASVNDFVSTTPVVRVAAKPGAGSTTPVVAFDAGPGAGRTTGVVTFAAGAEEAIFDVTFKADSNYTTDNSGVAENFTVLLQDSQPTNSYTLGAPSSQTGKILNDDQLVTVAHDTALQEAADGSTRTYTYNLTRTGKTDQALTVNWEVPEGGTLSAAEFEGGVLPTGNIQFNAGVTTASFTIAINGDTAVEGDETFKVKLTSPSTGVEFQTPEIQSTVNDDDTAFAIAAQSETVNEGAQGDTTQIPFKITRTGDLNTTATLKWAASGDTGTLTATSGTIELQANQSEAILNLQGQGNNTLNAAKNITVTLDTGDYTITPAGGRTVGNITFPTSTASTQLVDDDTHFAFATSNPATIAEGTQTSEGQANPKTVSIAVERTGILEGTQTVNWKIIPTGTNPVDASDFHIPSDQESTNGFPSGTLTFTDGTAKNIELQVMQDDQAEFEENFQIVLESTADNISSGAAYDGTLSADDTGYSILALDASKNEGQGGNTAFTFKVIRVGATDQPEQILYNVTGNGDHAADATDFGGTLPSGSHVDFDAGETEKTLTINVTGDATIEQTEGFRVVLFSPGKPQFATGTIISDDIFFDIAATNSTVTEGNGGSTPATFTVTRTGDTTGASTVNWQVVHGTTDSSDFAGSELPSETLSFAAGETEKVVTVNVAGDSKLENNEGFHVQLLSPSGTAVIQNASASGTINNDDAEYQFDRNESILEGSSLASTDTKDMTFTVLRSGKTDQQTTVNWALEHGTTNSSDFGSPTSGELTFANGETSKVITLKIKQDMGLDSVEADEAFTINLSGASPGSSIKNGHTSASGTILNDDTGLVIDKNLIGQTEKKAGEGNVDFVWTLSRSGYTDTSSSLSWTSKAYNPPFSSQDAISAAEIIGGFQSNQQLTWNAGDTSSKTITISATSDDNPENDEWFQIDLSNYTGFDQLTIDETPHESTASDENTLRGELKRDESNFQIDKIAATEGGEAVSEDEVHENPIFTEGNGQNTSVWFKIDRDFSSSDTATVEWYVKDGSTSTLGFSIQSPGTKTFFISPERVSTDATDFVTTDGQNNNSGKPSGIVSFGDGETEKWVEIQIQGDLTPEQYENFGIAVRNPSAGSSVSNSTDYVTIAPDDSIFRLHPAGDSETGIVESDGGSQEIQVKVERLYNTTGAASVDWTLVLPNTGGTEQDPTTKSTWYKAESSDFAAGQAFSGTLDFSSGEDSKYITLNINNDDIGETWMEHFRIDLSNATAGTGSDGVGIDAKLGTMAYVIFDDDAEDATEVSTFSVVADKTEAFEGGPGGAGVVTYTITRTGNTATEAQVAWSHSGLESNEVSFSGDGASIAHSNEKAEGVLNFAAGETTKTVTANWVADTNVEANQNISFLLEDPSPSQRGSLSLDNIYTGIGGYSHIADLGTGRISTTNGSVNVTQKNDDIRLYVNASDGIKKSEDESFSFTVGRTGVMDRDITVDYTINNLNTSNADFKAGTMTGSFVMGANQSSKVVTLDLFEDDSSVEAPQENFQFVMSAPGDNAVRFGNTDANNTPTSQSFVGSILDDDQTYSITTSTPSITETDDSTIPIKITLVRDNASTGYQGAVTVNYRIEGTGANAADNNDFQSMTGALSLNTFGNSTPDSFEHTLNIVKGDLKVEASEEFKIILDSVSSGKGSINTNASHNSQTITITNNDTGISIADAQINESDADQNLSFTVTRSGVLTDTSSVNWTLQHGTTNSADFGSPFNGTLTFDANESTQTIVIPVKGDTLAEGTETFSIVLSGNTNTNVDEIIDGNATGTIFDNESNISIQSNEASGLESGGNITFTVTRSDVTHQNQTVSWAVTDTGTHTVNKHDFGGTLPSGNITFSGNELTKTISVPVNNDETPEPDETFKVTLSAGNGTTEDSITKKEGTGKIISDDSAIRLVLSSSEIPEGTGGNSHLTFKVVRDGATTGTASVNWALEFAGNTATSDDFTGAQSGTVAFAAGESEQTVQVAINADAIPESDEGFSIRLSDPQGAPLIQELYDATLVNDDTLFSIEAPSTITEGSVTGQSITLTIKRAGTLDQAGSVQYALDASSVADASDLVSSASGTVNFASGDSEKTITIHLNGDRNVEGNENLVFKLLNPSANHGIATEKSTTEILDDDSDLSIAALQETVVEGDTTGGTFTFRVTRTGLTTGTENLNWTVVHGTTDKTDFDSGKLPSGTITLNPGETTADITVDIHPDYMYETDETFSVQISGAQAGTDIATASATATIQTDDDQISLTQNPLSLSEDNSDNDFTTFTYTVTRTNGFGASSVNWAIQGSGTHAADSSDFEAMTGSVQFADQETSKTFEVKVRQDRSAEYDEGFTVSLDTPAQGSTIKSGFESVTSTIVNDDPALVLTALDTTKDEGNTLGHAMRFEVTRTGVLTAESTVKWAVTGEGTHAADILDFGGFLPSGNLTFDVGESTKAVYVGVLSDTVAEQDETFKVTLSEATGAEILQSEATATIQNDDTGIFATSLNPTHEEGHTGTTAYQFKIQSLGTITGNVTANWKIAGNGNHAAGADDFDGNALPSGTVTLNASQPSQTVTVHVKGDSFAGPDETFHMVLENVQGAQLIQTDTTTTIQDDDSVYAFKTLDRTHAEGNSGDVTYSYDVERTGYLNQASSVQWKLVATDGSGVDSHDFVDNQLPQGTLNFASGDELETLQFKALGDSLAEGNENFRVELFNPASGSTINAEKSHATGTITNEDQSLEVVSVHSSHEEGNDFSDPFTFDVFRSGKVDASMEVSWKIVAVNGQSAPDSSDFSTPMNGTFTWQANEATHRLTLQAIGDTMTEADEHFAVEVSASEVESSSANGVIQNDDQTAARLRWSEHTSESHELVQSSEASLATSEDLAATNHDGGTYAIYLSMSDAEISDPSAVDAVSSDEELDSQAG